MTMRIQVEVAILAIFLVAALGVNQPQPQPADTCIGDSDVCSLSLLQKSSSMKEAISNFGPCEFGQNDNYRTLKNAWGKYCYGKSFHSSGACSHGYEPKDTGACGWDTAYTCCRPEPAATTTTTTTATTEPEAPTEAPTMASTEAPTEAPTVASTEACDDNECIVNFPTCENGDSECKEKFDKKTLKQERKCKKDACAGCGVCQTAEPTPEPEPEFYIIDCSAVTELTKGSRFNEKIGDRHWRSYSPIYRFGPNSVEVTGLTEQDNAGKFAIEAKQGSYEPKVKMYTDGYAGRYPEKLEFDCDKEVVTITIQALYGKKEVTESFEALGLRSA